MQKHIKTTLALLISLITGFTWHTVAQVGTEPVPMTRAETHPRAGEGTANYIFETIDVPGVDFLEVTASNDLGHYAGNTRPPRWPENHRFYAHRRNLFHLRFSGLPPNSFFWTQQRRTGCGLLR